jgi:hypothetical protein
MTPFTESVFLYYLLLLPTLLLLLLLQPLKPMPLLMASYFRHVGHFYEQIDGVAVGSPLSPVTANFMYDVEKMAATTPLCWFRYVDNTFVIWPHGPESLRDLPRHLNSVHQNILFTMETERDGHLPFLETDIYVRPDSTLGHKVYGKPTHTNLYLNSSFHHHPSNRHAVFIRLVHRALCDQGSLHAELVFLEDIFRQNGYTDRSLTPRPAKCQIHLLSYLMSCRYSTASAGCCLEKENQVCELPSQENI